MDKIKIILPILVVALSPRVVAAEGVEVASISTVDEITLAGDRNQAPVTAPVLNINGGYLEESEIAIGTILKSYHFSNKFSNETHNGVYISMNEWSAGTYINSADNQSVALTYNNNLYRKESFKVNLVTGVANGYEGVEYAQGDYLPILGVSAHWGYLKTVLLPNAVVFGLELPMN